MEGPVYAQNSELQGVPLRRGGSLFVCVGGGLAAGDGVLRSEEVELQQKVGEGDLDKFGGPCTSTKQ